MKKRIVLTLFLLLPFAAAVADDGIDSYVELIRADLRADKQALVTAAMGLTDADAKTFWPIYREYEAERMALGDRQVDLLKRLPDAVEGTSEDTLRMLTPDWFKLQEDRVKLWKKYHKKVEKEISPRVAARWIQIEYRISTLINLQISSEVPLIRPLDR